MPTLLFATRNLRKKQLFSPVFVARGIRFLTLLDVGLDDIRVDVRITDHIPREENGKFRAVKSLVGAVR